MEFLERERERNSKEKRLHLRNKNQKQKQNNAQLLPSDLHKNASRERLVEKITKERERKGLHFGFCRRERNLREEKRKKNCREENHTFFCFFVSLFSK